MSDNLNDTRIDPSVMIAVDGSKKSLKAVDYAVRMTRLIPGLQFNLLYVLPQIPPFLQSEARTDGAMRKRMKALEAANERKAREILDEAGKHIASQGIESGRVKQLFRKRLSGLAKDILNQAEMGRYDALIVGRRGKTRAEELFMGSVSSQLVQHATNIPLWIVEGKAVRPNILVAVDGSEASLRAVDHVGFMLGSNPEAVVHFLHVTPKLQSYCAIDLTDHKLSWEAEEADVAAIEEEFHREDSVCLDDFNRKAVNTLRRAGFSQDRIYFEEREISMGVARTVLKVAREGDCGTIVVGRRGLGKSSFLGGISDRIIRRSEDRAVWLVN